MKKKRKLTGFEKRVRERHKQQEKEFGRDEFLFGVEEDETADIEFEEDEDMAVAAEAEPDDAPEPETVSKEEAITHKESSSGIGETTAIIADSIIAEQLGALAAEMGQTTTGENAALGAAVPPGEEGDEEDSDFYTGEVAADLTDEYAEDDECGDDDDAAIAASRDAGEVTEDFDFYDMPKEAEAAAMAAVAAMVEAEEAGAMAEAELKNRKASGNGTSAGKKTAGSGASKGRGRSRKATGRSKSGRSRNDEDLEDRGGFFGGITGFFANMSVADRLIVATGICVLVVAIISGTVFVNARTLQKQVAEFDSVGSQVAGIYVVGEDGLGAVVSARADYVGLQAEEEIVAEEPEEPIEIVLEEKNVQIVMKVASVQSDLKIKFSNKETGKLISGVAFGVTVKSDAGKEYKWVDENKDGLIYHTEVPNGTYSVSMDDLPEGEKDNYTLAADVTGVKVTDKIEYKKVDVADEVKSEAEVNVAAEDTGKQDAVVESVLTDTVEWVESTKTLISGSEDGYKEIDKSSIELKTSRLGREPAPLVVRSGRYELPIMGSESDAVIERQLTEDEENLTEEVVTGEDEQEKEKTEEETGKEKKEDEGSPDDKKTEAEDKKDDEEKQETEVVDADDSIKSVSLSKSSLTMKVGDTAGLKATVKKSNGEDGGGVSWWSSNEGVATVSDGTVTAVGNGTAVINAVSDMDGSKSATCSVTVSDGSESGKDGDKSSALKDSSGNQVYVKDSGGSFVAATLADYDAYDKFYVKSEGGGDAVYTYTGWQTIDGNTYFFDKNGNFVTGEQIIQGAKYYFNSDGHLSTGSGTMGIDVSKWNGSIDWNAVKNSGVSFAIIRCGYRGSSTGALIEDPKFRANVSGAKAAGLAVGAYFFTQATNEVEAVEEASMAASLCSGYGLSLPIFLDVEVSGGRGDAIGADMRTAVVKAFCQTVRNSGFAAGVYANKTWLTERMHASQLTSYKIWLAQYAASPTYTATRYDYWQYSSKGKISGISGNVDLNIRY